MLAVQTAVGDIGRKATTELSWEFDDMINSGDFQYGFNEDGIYLLNTTDADNGITFNRSFTLATTDFMVKNPKRGRSVYIGIDTDIDFTLELTIDEQTPRSYTVTPLKTGLQRIRVPIGSRDQGRYFKFKFSSTSAFRVDNMEGLFTVRSSGIRGY